MPYELDAVIGRFDLLRSRAAGVPGAGVAPLPQGLGLVPVTQRLLEERPLDHWSQGGTVAHVEARFHGGLGHQGASVWRSGEQV
ncbi:hypothetical protein ACIBCA_26815 [Kitasatospora sp. NPDC051170]|uniref:hypothetical protein n=1 Tax=Kitasatospora sp. NPDC051170 TaxID=3364056 RepID=UPI0037B1F28A